MSKELNDMMNEELKNQMTDISEITDADEKAHAIKRFCDLHESYLNGCKTAAEVTMIKCESKNLLDDPKKERAIKIGIAAAGIAFNLAVLIFGLKFEETGTVTSGFFKWGLNHFCK